MIVVINGYPTSGKDEFVNMCIKYLNTSKNIKGHNISSVDLIKTVAKLMRWNGEKDPISRKFLSDIKNLYSNYCEGPLRDAIEFDEQHDGLTFYHCREPQQIEKLVQLKPDTLTVLLRRYDTATVHTNHSDLYVEEYPYDYIIENIGDLNLLEESCKQFIEDILISNN